MKYGLNYQGSKNKLAARLFEFFPKRKNFYDLFCGGCAMTHYAMTYNLFERYVINDLNKIPVELFTSAIAGKYRNETRWISHEEFIRLRFADAYVACCFSFGGNYRSYAYSPEVEKLKQAAHYAIVLNDWSLLREVDAGLTGEAIWALRGLMDTHSRRIAFCKAVRSYRKTKFQLESLERLERLQSLESLESIQSLESHVGDYQAVTIEPDSVVYCDIPYLDKEGYERMGKFDYERFYAWCAVQTEPVFVSSYEMPPDKFVCVGEFKHQQTMNSGRHEVIERLFIPVHQKDDFKSLNLF